MAQHRIHFQKYLEDKNNHTSIFEIFEEYGVGNCKIELIETYPCENKEALMAGEVFVKK